MTLPASQPRQRCPWGRMRGTLAVASLLLSALDHLVTALIGWPPVAWMARAIAAPITETWRTARRGPRRTPIAIITIRTPPAPERTTGDANPNA
jgi:hypothetical protein